MDDENMGDLDQFSQGTKGKAKLLLLGDFDPEGSRIIRDPYYVIFVAFITLIT